MASARPSTIAELFAELDGPSEVARSIGVGQSTASEMKRRQSIPILHWPAIIALASKKKIALSEADLVSMHIKAAKDRPAPTMKEAV